MKKFGTIALVAVFAAVPAAFAQGSLSPGSSDPALPTENSGDFGQFVEGIGQATFTAAFDQLDTATSISIVNVTEMPSARGKSFQDGFASRESDVAALRGRLQNNPNVRAALEGNGVTLDNVVAIDASGDSTITLYVSAS